MDNESSSIIKRYLGNSSIENFRSDFQFLLKMIATSYGEYDLQIRDDYMNVYYKGNSMAKIKPLLKTEEYRFEVHHKFELRAAIDDLNDPRLSVCSFSRNGEYEVVSVSKKLVHPFFQKKVVERLCRSIENVNYGEEIAFEQSLITDNIGRKDLFIIDRQVQGGGIPGRLDLLALKNLHGDTFRFVVIEVKLGNNKELSEAVSSQISGYVEAITRNIDAFKECYERNYREKYLLGLFSDEPWNDMPENITIDTKVEKKIVVGFYSRRAKKQIDSLVGKHAHLKGYVQLFCNKIEVDT